MRPAAQHDVTRLTVRHSQLTALCGSLGSSWVAHCATDAAATWRLRAPHLASSKVSGPMNTPQKNLASHPFASTDETMSSVDYPLLEELDPSLVDGFQLFYEREVPFELRSASTVDVPTELGALEALRVKILVKGATNQLDAVRVELSSESNLFFHYSHDLDAKSFTQIQETQRLMVDFPDYPTVLLRMLNACIKEPHLHMAVLLLQPSGEARLDFIQNMEYKFVELLSCRFWASPEDIVRAQVSYRYNVVKARMQLLQSRLADINQMVKVKNPSLLLQLQRTAPRFPPGSSGYLSSGSPGGGGGMGGAGALQSSAASQWGGSTGLGGGASAYVSPGASPAKPFRA